MFLRIRDILQIMALASIFLCGSCSGEGKGRSGDGNAAGSSVAELPLPDVPAELTEPKERCAYVLEHFWDRMDFRDRSLTADTAFMEQNFVNFAALFGYADSVAVDRGVRILLDRGSIDPGAYDMITSTAARYLNEPNLPLFSEEFYVHFLRAMIDGNVLSDSEKDRPRYQLEVAMKNRPGSRAADFRFRSRDGKEWCLSDFCREHDMTLLLFYDPDCENCKSVIERLADTRMPEGTGILAVYAEGDAEEWERSKDLLPAGWTVGYAVDDILGEELYVLPAMPTIYLIERDGTVAVKDARSF